MNEVQSAIDPIWHLAAIGCHHSGVFGHWPGCEEVLGPGRVGHWGAGNELSCH